MMNGAVVVVEHGKCIYGGIRSNERRRVATTVEEYMDVALGAYNGE